MAAIEVTLVTIVALHADVWMVLILGTIPCAPAGLFIAALSSGSAAPA